MMTKMTLSQFGYNRTTDSVTLPNAILVTTYQKESFKCDQCKNISKDTKRHSNAIIVKTYQKETYRHSNVICVKTYQEET